MKLALPSPGASRRPHESGLFLIDCLAYIALLALILGMTFNAFYRTTDNSRNLSRNAADIARALNAGERWRDEVRRAAGPPQAEQEEGKPILRLRQADGDISYAFRDGTVFRRAAPSTNWVMWLPAVAASAMYAESRGPVICWHWDVELRGRQQVARVRPVFSFVTVKRESSPP